MGLAKPYKESANLRYKTYKAWPSANQPVGSTRPPYRFKWVPDIRNGKRRLILKSAVPNSQRYNMPFSGRVNSPRSMDCPSFHVERLKQKLEQECKNTTYWTRETRYWQMKCSAKDAKSKALQNRLISQRSYNVNATSSNNDLKRELNDLRLQYLDLLDRSMETYSEYRRCSLQLYDQKNMNKKLREKVNRLSEAHESTTNQFVDAIVSLSKLRNELSLTHFGRHRQNLEIEGLHKEREWDLLDSCMRTFDNFCISSPPLIAQEPSQPGSQFMRADVFINWANHTSWYMYNQLRRVFRTTAGIQLTQPDQSQIG